MSDLILDDISKSISEWNRQAVSGKIFEIESDSVSMALLIVQNMNISTKTDVFVYLCALNLLNAAIKTPEFKHTLSYSTIKTNAGRLIREIDNLKEASITYYYNQEEGCLYIKVEDVIFSFHQVPQTPEILKASFSKPIQWPGIRLQKIAQQIFNEITNLVNLALNENITMNCEPDFKEAQIESLKKQISDAYDQAPYWKDGWKRFASMGSKTLKQTCITLGYTSIRNAIECILKDNYVFKKGDTSKHEPPLLIMATPHKVDQVDVNTTPHLIADEFNKQPKIEGKIKPYKVRNLYRELTNSSTDKLGWIKVKDLMSGVGWNGSVTDFAKLYGLQLNKSSNVTMARISNISRYEILDDIYFAPTNSYPSNLAKLKRLALDEPWEENEKSNGLLDNYLCYTYARIKEEGKIALSENGLCGCWNTGLVDFRYKPIFCYMTRRSTTERWVFQGFCIDGENLGKVMANNIANLPSRALYFSDDNILFEPDISKLSVDYDHIITEHPSRLPEEWIRRALDGSAERLANETVSQYDDRIGKMISSDEGASNYLQTSLEQAIKISLMRCEWNYKTAIPYYDPNSKNIGWFLPLCIRSKDGLVPFAALVVTKQSSGRYQGQTIYKLSWAYRCARLVCRPDSDWLSPSAPTEDEIE